MKTKTAKNVCLQPRMSFERIKELDSAPTSPNLTRFPGDLPSPYSEWIGACFQPLYSSVKPAISGLISDTFK